MSQQHCKTALARILRIMFVPTPAHRARMPSDCTTWKVQSHSLEYFSAAKSIIILLRTSIRNQLRWYCCTHTRTREGGGGSSLKPVSNGYIAVLARIAAKIPSGWPSPKSNLDMPVRLWAATCLGINPSSINSWYSLAYILVVVKEPVLAAANPRYHANHQIQKSNHVTINTCGSHLCSHAHLQQWSNNLRQFCIGYHSKSLMFEQNPMGMWQRASTREAATVRQRHGKSVCGE